MGLMSQSPSLRAFYARWKRVHDRLEGRETDYRGRKVWKGWSDSRINQHSLRLIRVGHLATGEQGGTPYVRLPSEWWTA